MEKYIEVQPILNLGMLGSVSDGKSTAVFQLTGMKTQKHSDELKKNITIKPGYANLKIYKDSDNNLSNKKEENNDLIHHLSFVDCPGHQQLILTMLGSINLMNGVIVVVSVAEDLNTKKQLIQHLAAIKLANIKKIIICLNKIDLVKKEEVYKKKQDLEKILKDIGIIPNIIIPTSFSKNIGVNYLFQSIVDLFPIKEISVNTNEKPLFKVSRSFDINKNGSCWQDITGGVLGGSLVKGRFKVGDEIEIRPGIKTESFITRIVSIQTEKDTLNEIIPGGLMGIKTDIDPFYSSKDKLAGTIIGLKGHLPEVYKKLKVNLNLTDKFDGYWDPEVDDNIDLQIGTLLIEGKVTNLEPFEVELKKEACIEKDSLIIISRRLKIVGYCHIIT